MICPVFVAVWLAVPLFWSFGSANALPGTLTHGGCVVLQESFEAGEALALIERERCSIYYGMPNMVRALLEHPDHPKRRLGAMRTGLTIGPPEDITMTIEALGATELCNVYGSTETYGNCAVTDAHDPLPHRLNSQGLPLPGMTIRVLDSITRQPLPPGEIGQLAVGGCVTLGYFNAPELNAEAFDRDGYFLTGDLGSIEPDGRIRFRGRLKEMIKTGGVNVAPLAKWSRSPYSTPTSCRPMSWGTGSGKRRDRRGCGRTARRRSNRYRFDHRVLPRAVGKLQSSDPPRLSNGGTAPTHADGQNP